MDFIRVKNQSFVVFIFVFASFILSLCEDPRYLYIIALAAVGRIDRLGYGRWEKAKIGWAQKYYLLRERKMKKKRTIGCQQKAYLSPVLKIPLKLPKLSNPK